LCPNRCASRRIARAQCPWLPAVSSAQPHPDRPRLESIRDECLTHGGQVLKVGDTTILMRKSTWGSAGYRVVIALFTVWWTFGIEHLIHAVVAHSSAELVAIKLHVPLGTPATA
jgi:hypothetical protein